MAVSKILHLEDDSNDVELLEATLLAEGIGCEITVVSNREQFVTALGTGAYDLIVSDFSLPSFDGISALTLAKNSCPDIPFIFLSGKMGEDFAIDSLKQGATDYVLKTKMSRLGPAIERALAEKKEKAARKHAEKEKARASDEWERTFNATASPIFLLSPDLTIKRANDATHEFFGVEPEAIIGRKCHEIVHGTCVADENCPTTRMLKSLCRETALQKYGDRWIEAIVDPILDEEGNLIGIVHNINDITDQKRSEKLVAERFRLMEFSLNHSIPDILTYTLDEITSLSGSEIGFFHFVEGDQKTLSLQAWSTSTVKDFCTAEGHGLHYGIDMAGVWADALREKKVIIHNDYLSLPNRKGLPPGHAPVIREAVIPIIREDKVVAILGIGNKPKEYNSTDLELAAYLADITWEIIVQKRMEEDLKIGTNLLNESQQLGKVGGWEFNSKKSLLKWTEETYRIHEVEPYFTPTLENALSFYTTESRPIIEEAVRNAISDGIPFDLELEIISAKGNPRSVRSIGKASEETDSIYGFFQDITKYKAVENKLREASEYLEKLFDNANAPIIVWDSQQRITSFNRAFEALTGLTAKEAVGNSLDILFPDEFKFQNLLMVHNASNGENFENVEVNVKNKQGEILTLLWNSSTIFQPDGVTAIATIAQATNITLIKQATEERDRLIKAIEQSGEAIIVTDVNFHVIYVNPTFVTMTGYSLGDTLGKNIHALILNDKDFTTKKDKASYEECFATVSSGYTWTGRFNSLRKDGTTFTDETTMSPVKDPAGNITGYVAIKRDISEHLLLSEQLRQAQKMEAIGRLAAGVAHDFNNVLTVIGGLAELAKGELNGDDPIQERIEGIQHATERATALTRQLLAFARKQVVNPVSLNLNDAVSNLRKMLQRLLREDIKLEILNGKDLWNTFLDPSQLDQVLANLSVNARDAITGTGKISIETVNTTLTREFCDNHPGSTPGEYVCLTFSDSGSGMDSLTLSKIFEPFFTTKPEGKGTGLGLATVYGIIKQAGGYISVESNPGAGTTFSLFFKRHLGADGKRRSETAEIEARGTETIILVDDDEYILEVGRGFLTKHGYKVIGVRSPGEAILAFEREGGKVDLLATDIVMPVMDGKELSARLTKLNPKMKSLFLSGYPPEVILKRGILPEGIFFLQKPFSRLTLTSKVREVLDSKPLPSQ